MVKKAIKKKSSLRIKKINRLLKPVSVNLINAEKTIKKPREKLEDEVNQKDSLSNSSDEIQFFGLNETRKNVESVRERIRLDEINDFTRIEESQQREKDDKKPYETVNTQKYVTTLPTIITANQKNYIVAQNFVEVNRGTLVQDSRLRDKNPEKPSFMNQRTTDSWLPEKGGTRTDYVERVISPEDYAQLPEQKEDRRERIRRR